MVPLLTDCQVVMLVTNATSQSGIIYYYGTHWIINAVQVTKGTSLSVSPTKVKMPVSAFSNN